MQAGNDGQSQCHIEDKLEKLDQKIERMDMKIQG